jgi:NRAMP (natural resistance-associated macrophage protein)-like metal ion transporter
MFNKIKKLWSQIGPGIVTGAADDDPSGIATYSQTGAQFGFRFLWLAPYSFVLMGIVQEMCARIALVTGKGLAENIRIHFSKKWLYFCGLFVILANTLNIGADLGAMAEVVRMFFPSLSLWIPIILIAMVTVVLEIFLTYEEYSKYLKWLAVTLLAYIFTGMILHFDLTLLLYHTFVPSLTLDRDSIIIIAAILGTTISPYLFFWQTSQEVEDEISKGKVSIEDRIEDGPNNIKKMRFDVWFGMLFSNIVMFFIISVCASTLYNSGIHNIQSASQAAEALRPLAGNFSYILFAFGIISTGFLAIPVLAASSAYIFSETFSFNEGLYRKAGDAKAFYLVIVLSVFFGLLFNLIGLNPITALVYTSVANAVVSPIALVFIVLLAGKKTVMGAYKNGWTGNILGWITTLLMVAVGIAGVYLIF